jgi:hypothetical protein
MVIDRSTTTLTKIVVLWIYQLTVGTGKHTKDMMSNLTRNRERRRENMPFNLRLLGLSESKSE